MCFQRIRYLLFDQKVSLEMINWACWLQQLAVVLRIRCRRTVCVGVYSFWRPLLLLEESAEFRMMCVWATDDR